MSKNNAKKIHLLYGLIVSVLVIILGAALIASSLHIYRSDPTGDPYNPASISAHFHNIAVLVFVSIGAIVGGVLLNLIFPVDREKTRPIRNDLQLMNKAARKAGSLTSEQQAQIRKECYIRKWIVAACVICFVDLLIYPAAYLFLIARFSVEAAMQDILIASIIVLFPAVLGLLICHLGGFLIRQSMQRQTAIYKSAAGGAVSEPLPAKSAGKTVIAIRCAIAVVAIVFIAVGAFNGSAKDVLAKAVKICTECIGLG